ncbi:aldo/keto reductase [Microbacterium sp. ET2]|uniref:aldo/keto reductase n=1 Tax=Microbacterium albipurpureum TaxID=3050384 RepID=UPI00259C961A|nr:aldo/keto reductase [Microbacterium sp. ET2 (Ac-2212)]WJL96967.1 aldo/keto reductase [Microbacterium sp. ET2 (Ac-2212)]
MTTSEIVLGTMTFGAQVDAATARQMVDAAWDAGVTMFDTSNNYADGRSEQILGECLRGRRESVLVATKGGSPIGQADASLAGLGRKALTAAVEASLTRLEIDRIDVYYLHRPDPSTPFEETLAALADLMSAGKIRAVGQSNFAAWQITQLNAIAHEIGAPDVRVSQPMYNLLGRRIEEEYVACADYLGLTSIGYNPLAGGLLTGKHRFDETPTPGTRFDREIYRDRYWSEELFRAVSELQEIARQSDLSLIELALRWAVQRPETDAVLLGASSVDQLTANLAAASGPPLGDDVFARCDEVWTTLRGAAPAYNR